MIVITGGAGFIGSNLVKALNEQGRTDIIVVDDLSTGIKFINLVDCDIQDYIDKDDFLEKINNDELPPIEIVFHQGACSTTTEWDGRWMMQVNYAYSKALFHYCVDKSIPFIYASSASVYGANQTFIEQRQYEQPLNVYGYSKFLFDQYVRSQLPGLQTQVVGMRYFNVYGPRESHKGSMSSVAYHFHQQLKESGRMRLFEGSGGHENGEQRRDFIHVDDVVSVNLWFMQNPQVSGIFNVGTGRAQSFNDVANAVIEFNHMGKIEYIPIPQKLLEYYQSYTQADITLLRQAGYTEDFKSVEEGVPLYLQWLDQQ